MRRQVSFSPWLLLLPLVLAACAQGGGGGGLFGGAGQEPGPGGARVAAAGGCGADARQGLVGESVSVLDSAELPEDARILLPGMMATQDYRPGRLNISVNASDRVERVYCG